jgi:hypothetical protein
MLSHVQLVIFDMKKLMPLNQLICMFSFYLLFTILFSNDKSATPDVKPKRPSNQPDLESFFNREKKIPKKEEE